MARPQRNREARNRRASFLAMGLGLGFVVLAAGLVRLQVIKHAYYHDLAEQNRVRLEVLRAPRGRIFDRKGQLLADNAPAFSIVFRPPDDASARIDSLTAEQAEILERVLGLPRTALNDVVRRGVRTGVTTPFRRDVPLEILSQIEELRAELPHIDVQVEPRRSYPGGLMAAHLLGYAGQINQAELDQRKEKGYRLGDLIGRSGLERSYEEMLRGRDGSQYVVVNALGRRVGVLEDVPLVPAHAGRDLRLTLDLDVQRSLETAMAGVARGAGIAIDPRTGGVLALVSRPSFDPNEFARGLSRARWQEFATDPSYPLLDRAIQSAYPPGSTYKVVTSLAGLEEGVITTKTRFPAACGGGYRFGNRYYRCWDHRGHGSLDLVPALARSCDVYYYQLALRVGVDRLASWARRIGVGEKTGIDLPQERSGLVPTTKYYDRKRGAGRWSRGVTLNLGIGQGENLVTPIQLAQIASSVAMRGRVARPHLVSSVVDPETGRSESRQTEPEAALKLPEETWDALALAMEQVVAAGTGSAARVPGIRVAGKTGTAQNPGEDHALFICFAPVEKPEIAVAVVVENGGHGGSTAAPIARQVLQAKLAPETLLAQAPGSVPGSAPGSVPGSAPGANAAAATRAAVADTLLGD